MNQSTVDRYRAMWAKACEEEKEGVYDCRETAQLLGITQVEVRRLVSAGELVPLGKRQKRLQFTDEEITRYRSPEAEKLRADNIGARTKSKEMIAMLRKRKTPKP